MYLIRNKENKIAISSVSKLEWDNVIVRPSFTTEEQIKLSFGATIDKDGNVNNDYKEEITIEDITLNYEEYSSEVIMKEKQTEAESVFVKITAYSIANNTGWSYPNVTAAINTALDSENDTYEETITLLSK